MFIQVHHSVSLTIGHLWQKSDPQVDWHHIKRKYGLVSNLFLMCLLPWDRHITLSLLIHAELAHRSSPGTPAKWKHCGCEYFKLLPVSFVHGTFKSDFLPQNFKTSKGRRLVHWAFLLLYSHSKYNASFFPTFYIYALLCRGLFVSFKRWFLSSFAFVCIHCQRKAFSWRLQNIRMTS